MPIRVPNCTRANRPNSHPTCPLFLMDSGATHDVISETYAKANGLMEQAHAANQLIPKHCRVQNYAILRQQTNPVPTDHHKIKGLL
jgi:hypothetical protein